MSKEQRWVEKYRSSSHPAMPADSNKQTNATVRKMRMKRKLKPDQTVRPPQKSTGPTAPDALTLGQADNSQSQLYAAPERKANAPADNGRTYACFYAGGIRLVREHPHQDFNAWRTENFEPAEKAEELGVGLKQLTLVYCTGTKYLALAAVNHFWERIAYYLIEDEIGFHNFMKEMLPILRDAILIGELYHALDFSDREDRLGDIFASLSSIAKSLEDGGVAAKRDKKSEDV
jgi:hypothetical protein